MTSSYKDIFTLKHHFRRYNKTLKIDLMQLEVKSKVAALSL